MPTRTRLYLIFSLAVTWAPICAADDAFTSADCPFTVLAMADPVPTAPAPEKAPADQGAAQEGDLCKLSVNDFARDRAGLIVADTRPHGERLRAGIPGALALEVAEIAQKSFLKDANVVIVGTGLDDPILVDSCTALRRQGMQRVRVLQGGVRVLFRHGHGLAGGGGDLDKLEWLAPDELHRFAAHTPTRVVLLDLDPALVPPGPLASAQRLASASDMSRNIAKLRQLAQAEPNTMLAVVAATNESARLLHGALRLANADNVYVARGGLPAYAAYLNQQSRIAANANVKLLRSCGTS